MKERNTKGKSCKIHSSHWVQNKHLHCSRMAELKKIFLQFPLSQVLSSCCNFHLQTILGVCPCLLCLQCNFPSLFLSPSFFFPFSHLPTSLPHTLFLLPPPSPSPSLPPSHPHTLFLLSPLSPSCPTFHTSNFTSSPRLPPSLHYPPHH